MPRFYPLSQAMDNKKYPLASLCQYQSCRYLRQSGMMAVEGETDITFYFGIE